MKKLLVISVIAVAIYGAYKLGYRVDPQQLKDGIAVTAESGQSLVDEVSKYEIVKVEE